MNIIHIEWEGPREIGRLDEFGGEHDKGLYQIYGDHPVYGGQG